VRPTILLSRLGISTIGLVCLLTFISIVGCGREPEQDDASGSLPDGDMATDIPAPPSTVSAIASESAQKTPTDLPTATPGTTIIEAPAGIAPSIDGTFSLGEWDSAMLMPLTNGGELMVMHNDGYLYLGIRSRDMGFGSICTTSDDQVSVLHSSAGLGTAIFDRDGDDWLRTQQFSYCCWGAPESEVAEFLQREGWVASLGTQGVPEEMEYQIEMKDGALTLAVVYVDDFSFESALHWPDDLDDDCLGLALIAEDPPERLEFFPDSWVTIILPPSATGKNTIALSSSEPVVESDFLSRPPITPENAADIVILRELEIPEFIDIHETCGVAFSPDGAYLAAACRSTGIPMWDVASGQLSQNFGGGGYVWANVAFSPDGKSLATSGQDRAIYVWDVSSAELIERISGAPGYMSEVAFSPDGQLLASGSFLGSALLWDVPTSEVLLDYNGHGSRVNSIRFHPDGDLLVTGGGDNKARVWKASSGEEILVLSGATHFVEDVEFSPGGQQIVGSSDDSNIYMWDADTGDLLQTFRGHSGPVNGVTYSPDGRLLASTSNDRTLRLWGASSGEALARLSGHQDLAIRSVFNSEGTLIASVSWDGKVRLWGLPDISE
jgi:WD40 repeat protein